MLFLYCSALLFVLKIWLDFNFFSYLFAVIICFSLSKKILYVFFDIEVASSLDVGTSIASENNSSYIIPYCTIDQQIDIPKIIKLIKERVFIHPHYQKLKKIFYTKYGICYWKRDPNFRIENHYEVIEQSFSHPEEIYKFVGRHLSHENQIKNQPKWKIYILPNLPDNKKGLMMKIQHGLADGLSLMNFLLVLGDSKEYETIHLSKIKRWQWIIIYALGLYDMVKFIRKIVSKKKDQNCFDNSSLCGNRNCYSTPRLDLNIIKSYSKTLNVSINDVLLALLALAIRNYHKEHFQKDLKEFSLMIAASLVPMPEKGEILPLSNNMNVILQKLHFDEKEDSFPEYVKKCHSIMIKVKKSYSIYFQHLFSELNNLFLHYIIQNKLLNMLTQNNSAVYTSVPGPTTSISLFGYDINELCFFVNPNGKMGILFNTLTYNQGFKMAATADDSTGMDCKKFIQEFERLFHKYVEIMVK